MDIGQKLKEKRTALGLSQEDLAKAVGVSRQTVSSWENNRSYPDIGSILKLSGSSPEILTVTEEYYHGDMVETTQYQLQKNRSGAYPFPDKFTRRYEDETQFVVYSFEYDGGVFLLRLEFD